MARRLAAYRSFYRFLIRTEVRTDDPTASLERPKLHPGLPRPVSDLDAALDRLGTDAQAVAVLLVETGLRISEAMAIDVEVPCRDLLLVRGKGDKERLVPLSPPARAALDELGGHIELSTRSIQRQFAAAGFTPHRLRHTLASGLAERDVDLSVIQDLLGHASPATTRVYQRNDVRRIREGLERR